MTQSFPNTKSIIFKLRHVVQFLYIIIIILNIGSETMDIKWQALNLREKNELIASSVLGWFKEDKQWFKHNSYGQREGPLAEPQFTSSLVHAMELLENFDTYQVTKMFPTKYRTIIGSNQNVVYSKEIIDSICIAALKARGIRCHD